MSRMHFLVLTPTFLPALGGAELVILNVFRRIAKRHRVTVLTPYLKPSLLRHFGSAEYDDWINFRVIRYRDRISFMRIPGHRLSRGAIPPFSLSALTALGNVVSVDRPDAINVHYTMPTGLAALYAEKVRGVPTVLTFNGRDVPGPGVPPLWKYWHRLIGNRCTDVTFVSGYCRAHVFGAGSNKGHVLYNGVEPALPATETDALSLRDRLGLPRDSKILFCLQRLDPLKGVDVILRSFGLLRDRGLDAYLVIGGKGGDRYRLADLSREMGLTGRVRFVGFIPDHEVPLYYRMSDLFVFHSYFETFGMVLAEAMNYGKAIVSVAETAVPEVVIHGENGLLVPGGDSLGMAEAIARLLADPLLRQRMAVENRKRIRRYFEWEEIARQYEAVLVAAAQRRSLSGRRRRR